MYKKLLASCLLLSIASSGALANYKKYHHYKNRTNYKGEYKGEYKGLYKGEVTTIVQPAPAPDFTPCNVATFIPGPYIGVNPGLVINYNRTASVYKGFQGTLFGGFAMLNDSFYLAAEIFGQHDLQIQNYRNDINDNGNPIGLKTTWGFGVSVLPGFILADTLLSYLRIGGVETHFQEIGQTAAGGQVGIGLQGVVSENWDVRAEYTYTFYQSLRSLGAVRSDTFRLGVLYKFWG